MCDDNSSTCPIHQRSEEILKILKVQVRKLVDTIDDACKRLDIVSKKASDDQKPIIETIKTALMGEAEKLKSGTHVCAADMSKAFDEAVQVVSTELEKVSKENLFANDKNFLSLTKRLEDFKKK